MHGFAGYGQAVRAAPSSFASSIPFRHTPPVLPHLAGASAEGGYSASVSSGSTSSTTPTSAYTSQGATADASGYGSQTDVYVKGVAVQNGGYYYPSNLAVDKASADCK
jgi:hypothetical protein